MLDGTGPSGGLWNVTANQADPQWVSSNMEFPAISYHNIEIRTANQNTDTSGKIYFKTDAENFYSEDKTVTFTNTNGGGWFVHSIDMTGNAKWTGKITGIRIDPIVTGSGQPMGIDYVRLIRYDRNFSPAVSSQSTNGLDLFQRGADNQLYQDNWNGSVWSGWTALGGPTYGTFDGKPASVSWGSGRIDVIVQGLDNAYWHKFYANGVWSSWSSLGGSFTGSPAISKQGTNMLDVFGRGSDGILYQDDWNGTAWSGWLSLGGPTNGTFIGAPASVSWGSGRIDLVVRGTDNAVWFKFYSGGVWSSWSSLGGGFSDSPAISTQGTNELDIFGRGSDNKLYQETWNGSAWSGWVSLGGPSSGIAGGAPAAVSWSSGRIDVFSQGTSGTTLWHNFYASSVWSGWHQDT